MQLPSIILGGAVSIIAVAGTSMAEPLRPPPGVAAPAATYNWTGIYGGIVGGWNRSRGRGHSSMPTEILDPPPGFFVTTQAEMDFRSRGSGALFGGTIGANYQIGMIVFGVEGDLAWTDTSGHGRNGFTQVATVVTPGPVVTQVTPGVLSHRWDMNWFSTGRLRAGVTPADRLLIFGTLGLAAAGVDLKTRKEIDVVTLTTAKDSTYYGWTAGAGGEYALTPRIRLKADWLYYDLGSESHQTRTILRDVNYGFATRDGLATQRSKLDLTGYTFRGGVNIGF